MKLWRPLNATKTSGLWGSLCFGCGQFFRSYVFGYWIMEQSVMQPL